MGDLLVQLKPAAVEEFESVSECQKVSPVAGKCLYLNYCTLCTLSDRA